MKGIFTTGFLLLVCAGATICAAEEDVLGNPADWKRSTEWAPTEKGPLIQRIVFDDSVLTGKKVLRVDVINDGDGKENYPSILRTFAPVEDWTKYRYLKVQLMVKTDNADVRFKTACFVIQNQPAPGEKAEQQKLEQPFLKVPVNTWVDYKSSLEYVKREKVQNLFPHLYELGFGEGGGDPNKAERITWYISEIKLCTE